eukprot:1141191-Pelagomonas_calceolata.AAC.1
MHHVAMKALPAAQPRHLRKKAFDSHGHLECPLMCIARGPQQVQYLGVGVGVDVCLKLLRPLLVLVADMAHVRLIMGSAA